MSKPKLPDTCLTHIFYYLDRTALCKYARVNKLWASMALPLAWQDPFPVIAASPQRQFQFVEACLQCLESTPFLVAPLNITFNKRLPYYKYIKYIHNLEFCMLQKYVVDWLEEQSAQSPVGVKFGRFFSQLTGGGNAIEPQVIASIIAQRVADRCTSLQCLSVRLPPDASDDELGSMIPKSLDNFSHITELVWFVNRKTESTLMKLAKVCKNLRSITVAGLAKEDDRAVATLVRAQKNLEEIKLGLHSNYWRHTIAALETQAASLEVVQFASVQFHPRYPLEGLAKCTQLRSLTFTGCLGISSEVFAPLALAKLPRLQHLEFDLEDTPEDAAEALIRGSFATLERLAFQHSAPLLLAAEQCPRLTYLITTVSETESTELEYLLTRLSPQLEGLGFKGTYMDESGNVDWLLRLLGKFEFPNLTYLGLGPDVWFSSTAMGNFLVNSRPPLETVDLVTSFSLTDEYLMTFLLYVGQTLNVLEIISSEEPRASRKVIEYVRERISGFQLVTQS